MAKATQTKKKTTTKVSFKKSGGSGGDTMKCNVCGGSGVQKKPSRKKK